MQADETPRQGLSDRWRVKRFMRLKTNSVLMVVGMVAAVAQARPPTLIESLSRPILGATAIAPDGQRIAYLKRETDWKNNEYVWQL